MATLMGRLAALERQVADRPTQDGQRVVEAIQKDPAALFAMCQPPVTPDQWQRGLIRCSSNRVLLLAARQVGKSFTCSAMALAVALTKPKSLTLVFSPSMRQSSEMLLKIRGLFAQLGQPVAVVNEAATQFVLANGSRVLSLPDSGTTTRGFSAPDLVLVDEASRISDELLVSIWPMLSTNPKARLVLLSSPAGRRGIFHDAWENGTDWHRVSVRGDECPRISKTFLEQQRRDLGELYYSQEFCNAWIDLTNCLFAAGDIERAFTNSVTPLWADQ